MMNPAESQSIMAPLAHSNRFGEDFGDHSFSAMHKIIPHHHHHESEHHHHHHNGTCSSSRHEGHGGVSNFPRSKNIPIKSQRNRFTANNNSSSNNSSNNKVPKKRFTGDVPIHRSSSEIRLQEELEMADFRDYVFFARLVEGISQRQELLLQQQQQQQQQQRPKQRGGINGKDERCYYENSPRDRLNNGNNSNGNLSNSNNSKILKTTTMNTNASSHNKNLNWQRQNDLCLARIIGTRNGWIDQNQHHHWRKESRQGNEYYDDDHHQQRNHHHHEEEGKHEEMFILDM